eukprot:gene46116-25917_t
MLQKTWGSDVLAELIKPRDSDVQPLAPLDAAWQPYANYDAKGCAGASASQGEDGGRLSAEGSRKFISDYFDAFVAHVVPSIVFAWIFLKECPASHQE